MMPDLSSLTVIDRSQFFESNQRQLAELLTFVEFAQGLTIGFIEIEQDHERDWIIEWLTKNPQCPDLYFLVVDCSDRELRFLLDKILESLPQDIPNSKELVIIIKGLEESIGAAKYPPVLQNLNFMRDAFINLVPHPILFCLPSYQVTSIARFAPDFWAWKSGIFKFELVTNAQPTRFKFQSPLKYLRVNKIPEPQSRIDLLERLLAEYPDEYRNDFNSSDLLSIFQQLGKAYHSRQEWQKAEFFLTEALRISEENLSFLLEVKTELWTNLADVYREQQQLDRAKDLYWQAYDASNPCSARIYNELGIIWANEKQHNIANNLNTAHGLFNPAIRRAEEESQHPDIAIVLNNRGNVYSTLAQIGVKSIANLRQAIADYNEAVVIEQETAMTHELSVILNNRGNAYSTLAQMNVDSSTNQRLAIADYNEADRLKKMQANLVNVKAQTD